MPDLTPLLLVIALGGAALAGWLTPRRPLAAFGILFALASLSRATIETPIGTMRMEQPAIAVVAIVLIATGRIRALGSLPRWAWLLAGCLAVYLAALAASSILVAPDRVASVRIVVWWAISMGGGVVALLLVGQRGREAILPLGSVGALTAAIGIVEAVGFFAFGPGNQLGIQNGDILPRVYGIAWEANLYSSFVAACVPFGLELARDGRHRLLGIAIAAVLLVAMPLGVTRAAFVGLAVGMTVYLGTLLWRSRRPSAVAMIATATAAVTIVGIGLASVLLPDPLERVGGIQRTIQTPAPVAVSSGHGESPAPVGSTAPVSTPTPLPPPPPPPDTVAYRLERIPMALADLPSSPVIGLGAESFGQRHDEAGHPGWPDHLIILAAATVYESGIVGALALALAFVVVAVALWRTTRMTAAAGPAAAYLGSLAVLLIAYQATTALDFAINWMIIGAAVAVAAWPPERISDAAASQADAG